MNAAKRLEIFRRLHEDNPEPKTELAYSSPFELLIAVILSAQSTDVGVNKATDKLFAVYNTPQALIDGLHSFYSSFKNTTMTNHVPICKITYNQVMIGT